MLEPDKINHCVNASGTGDRTHPENGERNRRWCRPERETVWYLRLASPTNLFIFSAPKLCVFSTVMRGKP